VDKFEAMGFDTSGTFTNDLNTSASFAAEHCESNGLDKVFAIGEPGLFAELRLCGINVLHEEGSAGLSDRDFEALKLSDGVKAVVVGYDHEFSYKKLCIASLYLQAGARLVVTNMDSADRVGGRMQPGNGCNAAAILQSLDNPNFPMTVTGKPNPDLLDQLLLKYNMDPAKTIMCGDRLDTDILFGGGKIDTLLVLSGVSTSEHVRRLPAAGGAGDSAGARPTYVADTLLSALEGGAVDGVGR
jgi:ribonucleotide monophosphatase NagD (HAD superfamily)